MRYIYTFIIVVLLAGQYASGYQNETQDCDRSVNLVVRDTTFFDYEMRGIAFFTLEVDTSTYDFKRIQLRFLRLINTENDSMVFNLTVNNVQTNREKAIFDYYEESELKSFIISNHEYILRCFPDLKFYGIGGYGLPFRVNVAVTD